MPTIKDGYLVEDCWLRLSDEIEIPKAGDILLSLEHAIDYVAMGAEHDGRLGVYLKSDENVARLIPLLSALDLIVLEFSAFTDGRAYSQATRLRKQLGFKGELRARGNILIDQLQLMRRCGFDSFEITDKRHFKVWQDEFFDLDHAYQRRSQPIGLLSIRQQRAANSGHGTADR